MVSFALTAGVVAVTFAAFGAALDGHFLRWDDEYNFTDNPHYRGLGWAQIAWMFGAAWSGHWAPLTWLTLGLDWALWGMNPLGYHVTSTLLHAANAALFVVVARGLLARALPGTPVAVLRAGAVVAALLFAIHPLRAESVAWISERRDVVSGFFYLLTIVAYLRASEASAATRRRWLAVSVAAFAGAMTSKAIAMSLPLVLLVLDVYPLRRLSGRWRDAVAPPMRSVLLEKVPYVLIAVAGAALAARVATEFNIRADYPLWARPAAFGYNLVFYVWKSLLPVGLSPLYELPARWQLGDTRLLAGLLAPAAVTAALVWWRARWPAGLAVWIVYAVTLMPVTGLVVHTGPQLTADRYSYLAGMGGAVLAGGAVCLVLRQRALAFSVRRLAIAATGAALAGLAVLSWQQSEIWRTDVALWEHAVAVDPECARCQQHLGSAYHGAGASAAAVAPMQRAVALRPDFPQFNGSLGQVLLWLGRTGEALPHLQQAADAYPDNLLMQTYLGAALAQVGRGDEARGRLEPVLRAQPNDVEALTAMGFALAGDGRTAEAVPYFERAAGRAPRAAAARIGLVHAYRALGETARAEHELETLRTIDPQLAEAAARR
jgi:tetratricopeptide (TPR) repeat protein